jgi:serine/threonine protein kinase
MNRSDVFHFALAPPGELTGMNPQSFGKYQLIKKLATGGMAEVWLARQTGIEGFAKNVVVKRILPHLSEDAEFVAMFGNEARIAALFNHPNIAQVYEFGEANGTYFIAMEYIHGEDLGRVMRKAYNAGGWLPLQLAIRIVASACEGLYYAHMRADDAGRPLKVVHRDISPQNILVSFDGSVKLVDFGIAKAADQASMTKSGAIKGKFAYMAPEQAAGKPLDHRADIFAIGLVLYELVTGQRPLKRESELGTLQAALECNIPAPSEIAEVPAELDAVVMKALAKAADDRYQTARQFQIALEGFLVSQRWVASSVQLSELMEMLFADRLEEERRSGDPEPKSDESLQGMPAVPVPPAEPPPPPRTASRVEPRNAQADADDMKWEAPPGEVAPQQKPRTGTRASLKRTESTTLPMSALEEDELQAPPAVETPNRRRTSAEAPRRSPPESTAVARVPSRTDAPAGRRTGAESSAMRRASIESPSVRRSATRTGGGPEAEGDMPAPRPSRGGTPALNPRARPVEEDADSEKTILPPPEPEQPRRRTGMAPSSPPSESMRRRTSSRVAEAEPQPPVRRRTSFVERTEAQDDDSEAVRVVTASTPVPGSKGGVAKLAIRAVLVLAVVGVVAVFHKPLWGMLNSTANDSQSISINLDANERVQVAVKHVAQCPGGESVVALGMTPLRNMGGVHVQDTLVLENKQRGIYKELTIPPGDPTEVLKTLSPVEFKTGSFRLKLQPRNASGIEIHRDGQKLGVYQPGLKLELVEGTHHLTLQGASLKGPVSVDVEVKARGITDKDVDLTSHLVQ